MKIVEFDENGEEITDERKAGQILRENWHSLIPLGVLILIVLFRTINVEGLKFDLVPELLGKIQVLKIGEESISLYSWLSQVTILKGLSNGIVLSLIFVTIVSFFFKKGTYCTLKFSPYKCNNKQYHYNRYNDHAIILQRLW